MSSFGTDGVVITADVGTSSVKVCAFDLRGELLSSHAAPHATTYHPGGRAEQTAEDWLSGLCTGLSAVLRQVAAGRVQALSFTGQMACCLPVGADGLALRPGLIWADRRATDEARHLADTLGPEQVYRLTGNRATPMYLGPKARWIKTHEPDIYRQTAVFLQAQEYLVNRLTGVAATDPSNASCSALFGADLNDWSPEIVAALGIDVSKLPPVQPGCQVTGHLRPEMAALTGLRSGTPVVLGGGDGPATAVGLGVVAPGQGYVSVGSSAWLSLVGPERFPRMASGIENYRLFDQSMYAWTASMQGAGVALEWAARTLFPALSTPEAHTRMGTLAQQIHRTDLLFLPYLIGERAPYWNDLARGAFIGLHSSHTLSDVCAAVFQGIALHLRLLADLFAQVPFQTNDLLLVGGSVRAGPLAQMIADALGQRLVGVRGSLEATSLGAFAAARVALGLLPSLADTESSPRDDPCWEPIPEATAHAEQLLPLFRQAYIGLEPVFAGLGRIRA